MDSLGLGFARGGRPSQTLRPSPGPKARPQPHDLDSESGSATGSAATGDASVSGLAPQVRLPRTAQIQTPSESDARTPPATGTEWSGHGFSALFSTPLGRLARHNSDVHQSTPLLGLTKYFEMPPEDSVYSYFLFMPPVDQRRTKKWITPLICFGGILVIVNFCMQTMLLFVVGGHIKSEHSSWVSQISHLKKAAWYHVIPMPYNFPVPACVGEDSPLCREYGDGISCAPPSIHLLNDWDLLDTNKDGVWSREEAHNERLREQVQCDYGIDLASFHSSIAHSMNASEMMKGRRHNKDLFTGNGIHKAFFNWYMHKPLLCQYGGPDMCGSLFKRGFFDEALRNHISEDFNDVSSAVQYCNKVLADECFSILPNTYRVWRSRSEAQCGEKIFGQSMYAVPNSNTGTPADNFPMLTVSFGLEDIYFSTTSLSFRSFFLILLVAFLAVMYLEIKNILNMFIWIITFPADEGAGKGANVVSKRAVVIRRTEEEALTEADEDIDSGPEYSPRPIQNFSKEIFAVRFDHRMMVLAMTVLRLLLWIFLLWSGTMFLTGKPRYLNLIFDALSLVFIFEIDELLYKTMLRYEFKKDHMSIADMRVPTLTQVKGRTSVWTSLLELFAVILFGWCIMQTYCDVELNPLSDALACLCSRDGPSCVDAQTFSKAWWDEYWSMTMPAATRLITKLRES